MAVRFPSGLEELTALPGVGRKTANVIRGNIFHEPSVVVDTHVKRISKKLGLAKEDDPEKVEYELMKVLPKDHWIFIQYSDHHTGADHLQGADAEMRGMFSDGMV